MSQSVIRRADPARLLLCAVLGAVSPSTDATIQVQQNGCILRLQCTPVSGASQYRWHAVRSDCGGGFIYFAAVPIGNSSSPELAVSSPLPFPSCWFRVDAVAATGAVLQSEYSVSPPPQQPWPIPPESPYQAGPPVFELLGFEGVWVDPGPAQLATARFWVQSPSPTGTSFQWYRDAQPIEGATGSTLELPVALSDDGARISVAASNPCGTVLSPERTIRVSVRPSGSGVRWIDLTELTTRGSATWCCPSQQSPPLLERTVTTRRTGSTTLLSGVAISPSGATMANAQAGEGGRLTNLRRLTFEVPQWSRFSYSISSDAGFPASAVAALEGAGVTFPNAVSAAHVDLAPGTYTVSSTCSAGTICCGGPFCISQIYRSSHWSITFQVVPLCAVAPSHPECCPADLDASLTVDGADLGALLGSWGPCSGGCPSDFNRDGVTDGVDLGRLLNDWGACQ